MKRRIFALATSILLSSAALAQTTTEAQQLAQSTEALALTPRAAAYKRFIDIYLISSPHADKGIQGFVDRASKGDKDAFSFICFMIWQGYAGFKASPVNAKLALSSAVKDGSAMAAYFIGETFLQSKTADDAERAERYADSLYWYGMATGMGESRGHDRAMEVIKVLAPANQEHRRIFMGSYNQGLEEGTIARQGQKKGSVK